MLDKEINNNISNNNIENSIITQYKDCIFMNTIEDCEILNKIIREILNNTKKDMDIGNYSEVNKILTDYMTTEGFDKLSENLKIDIIYYRAISLLNMQRYDEAKIIAEQILRINKNSLRYYQFCTSLNILTVNREEYLNSIKKLKDLNEEERRIVTYDIKMLYNERNYNEIINKYVSNDNLNENVPKTDECVGIVISSLMIEEKIDLAINILENIDMESEYITYLKSVTNLYNILNNKETLLGISEEDKDVLDKNIDLLKSIKYYFDKNVLYKKGYYYYLLHAILIVNPLNCIKEYEDLDSDLKADKQLKLVYIDALLLTNQIELAEKNIREGLDYNNDITVLARLVDILYDKKDYKEIVKILEGKELNKISDKGLLASRYITAIICEKGFETVEDNIDNEYENIPLVNIAVAEILYFKGYNKEKIEKYCDRAIQKVDESNEIINGLIGEKCEQIGFINKCIQLLEKSEMKFIKTKKLYIRNVVKYPESSYFSRNKALKMIDEIMKNEDNSSLLIYKGELLKKINRTAEAFIYYDKAFENDSSFVTAYYCLKAKMENKEYFGIDKYLYVLDKSEELPHLLIVANAYSKLKKYNEANKKIYQLAYIIGNNVDMDIFATIVFGIYFQDYNEYKWEKIQKVDDNVIIFLEGDDKKIRKVCIDTDINIDNCNTKIYDVELYSYDSIIRNQLILKKQGEQVIIDGEKYTIKDLQDKYEYTFNKIRDMFFKNLPDESKYGKIIRTSSKNPLKDIMPVLIDRREYVNNIVDAYRLKNNDIGLTITGFSRKMGKDEHTIISGLLYDKDGIYYAGEVSEENEEEYVITLSSLIICKIFGIDKILLEIKDKIHISETTLNKLKKCFSEKVNNNSSAFLGVRNDDSPYMIENTDIEITQELEFIRELIELSNKFIIEKNNYEEDEMDIFCILEEDEQDSMCIAKNNNYTLIADDLCLRKIYRFYSKSNNHANSIEFIKYFKFTERVEILEKISETQYLYCVNKGIIIELLYFCKDKEKITKIIKNLLNTKEKYNYNRSIIGEAILDIYSDEVNTTRKKNTVVAMYSVFEFDKKYKEQDGSNKKNENLK